MTNAHATCYYLPDFHTSTRAYLGEAEGHVPQCRNGYKFSWCFTLAHWRFTTWYCLISRFSEWRLKRWRLKTGWQHIGRQVGPLQSKILRTSLYRYQIYTAWGVHKYVNNLPALIMHQCIRLGVEPAIASLTPYRCANSHAIQFQFQSAVK